MEEFKSPSDVKDIEAWGPVDRKQERYQCVMGNRKGDWTYTYHNHLAEFQTDEDPIDCMGTSLVGEMECSFYDIVERFGRPEAGDEYKIDAHWSIEFNDGLVATIYNWKNGLNYHGAIGKYHGSQLTDITEWHIGGKDKVVVDRIKGMVIGWTDEDEQAWRNRD